VELALTAPVLVLMVLGLAELGNGINSYLTIVAAARDGARLGAEGAASDATIVALVAKEAERLDPAVSTTCVSGVSGICVTHPTISSVESVRVSVCYSHQLIVGIPGIASGSVKMCTQTVMRVVT
jgi:Flp pilus assembly protein TadG